MPTPDALEAYVGPRFEHDIFVSYAQGIRPDSGEDPDLKTWTHALIDKLKEHVGYSLEVQRRPISVWYDGKLPKTAPLNDTLKGLVERSATLLIVMTPHYLASDWCSKERDWFDAELRRRGGGIENVVVVRAMATDQQAWPPLLQDSAGDTVLGFPFCNETEGRDARPFGWVDPSNSATGARFIQSLTELANELAARLDGIRKAGAPPPATVVHRSETQRLGSWPVVVVPGTEDVQPFVTETRAMLEAQGCLLLPGSDLSLHQFCPHEEDEAFESAMAFVQCIGMVAAKDGSANVGQVERLSRRAQQQGLKRYHWRNGDIPLAAYGHDPIYKAFVEEVGDQTWYGLTELAQAVVADLRCRSAADGSQPLTAYIQVPPPAIGHFDGLKRLSANNLNN